MNYADLFRMTLPETALEVAALVVLVVDLAFLRKAARAVCALPSRRCWACWGAARRLWRCRFRCRADFSVPGSGELLLAAGGSRPWRRSESWC